MAKLEGIIYTTFEGYIVLRGFAPIGDIAQISKKPESYQRDADDQHKVDIVKYLNDVKSYFPEITLACRCDDYSGLIQSIGTDKDVSNEESRFVKGLYVLSERLPQNRNRARHAYVELQKPSNEEKLTRVDGNHRLEPFDESVTPILWWHQFITNREAIKDETDEVKNKAWLDHQARNFKNTISSKIVPFTIIISDSNDADNFEAKVFHDINFRALPLREEASLKIISELSAFDVNKLGEEYPLALELINISKRGQFNAIPWLNADKDPSESYYRTSCLAIARLLISQKERIKPLRNKYRKDAINANKRRLNNKTEVVELGAELDAKRSEIREMELEQPNFANMTTYKRLKDEVLQLEEDLKNKQHDQVGCENKVSQLKDKVKSLQYFIDNHKNVAVITNALNSLIGKYKVFEKNACGNIAFLCTLVYYTIFDEQQLQSFIDWAERNGINRITTPDDLSKDAAMNLVAMFDQIYQAKKNEIFVSMQFGDSQSELIYEKIERAIEKFNKMHKSIHLNATPIRIDRTVESCIFSIQDKILEAIKSCSLIIADLSSANINVYHEIGYAMGVAQSQNMIPNLILLYKEDTDHNKDNKDIDKFVGFNLRNLSQLRFKDYQQLVDGLVCRLEKHYGVY